MTISFSAEEGLSDGNAGKSGVGCKSEFSIDEEAARGAGGRGGEGEGIACSPAGGDDEGAEKGSQEHAQEQKEEEARSKEQRVLVEEEKEEEAEIEEPMQVVD